MFVRRNASPEERNEPSFFRGSVSSAQHRRPDSPLRRDITVAGQCRNLTGLRWSCTTPGLPEARVTIADAERLRVAISEGQIPLVGGRCRHDES
jgi:hypothetical protein